MWLTSTIADPSFLSTKLSDSRSALMDLAPSCAYSCVWLENAHAGDCDAVFKEMDANCKSATLIVKLAYENLSIKAVKFICDWCFNRRLGVRYRSMMPLLPGI